MHSIKENRQNPQDILCLIKKAVITAAEKYKNYLASLETEDTQISKDNLAFKMFTPYVDNNSKVHKIETFLTNIEEADAIKSVIRLMDELFDKTTFSSHSFSTYLFIELSTLTNFEKEVTIHAEYKWPKVRELLSNESLCTSLEI